MQQAREYEWTRIKIKGERPRYRYHSRHPAETGVQVELTSPYSRRVRCRTMVLKWSKCADFRTCRVLEESFFQHILQEPVAGVSLTLLL